MKKFQAAAAAVLMTTASLTAPALAQGYSIRPGDVLRVEVVQDPSMNRTLLVAPDGRVSLPLAGSVQASGRSVEAIASAIATGLGPSFAATPDVHVSLERLSDRNSVGAGRAAGMSVHVMGEARKPGRHEVERGTTVLQLLAEMGGFDKFAATKRLQLRRGNTVHTINYDAIEAGQSNAGDTVLQAGDVLIVPQRRLFE